MGDVLAFPSPEKRLLEVADQLGYEALIEVGARYGTGFDDDDREPEIRRLAYHDMQHPMHVRDDTRLIAAELGLGEYEAALGVLAASAHDLVQLKDRGVMEQESADWLAERMRQEGFPERDIEICSLAVLGTEPLTDQNGDYVGQRAGLQDYPDEQAELIAYSVACADMAGLYAPYGPAASRYLFLEEVELGKYPDVSPASLLNFQRKSLDLLQHYRYPHEAGERLFGRLRQEVLEYQTEVTQDLALGNITSLPQLYARDLLFALQHGNRIK